MEKQMTVALPDEVMQIAKNVSVEKRTEVQNVLNLVFNGVSKMREQLEAVDVTDENDKVNMKLANTIRLGVRQVRLDAEKTFDAKRAEVQQQMLSFKTEDALWLKAKQTMQILTKEIEENARWKEETRQRFEADQRELKIQERMVKVAAFAPDIARTEFEAMSEKGFEIFLAGIEKEYNDRIEAEKKAEEDRIAREKAEEVERERVRVENERLRAEAIAKEKELAAERAKDERERKALEEKARIEREEAEKKLAEEREIARQAAEKAAAEKAKLEASIRAKEAMEERERQVAEARRISEQKAQEAAAKKAANAPDKVKLNALAEKIKTLEIPSIKGADAALILSQAKKMLTEIVEFIREESSKL